MATSTLEQRMVVLEGEIAELKQWRARETRTGAAWWERIRGDFKDDPDYAEAMRLGREYRELLRPESDDKTPK